MMHGTHYRGFPMPTTLPRITVALPPGELRHLDQVATAMRKSRSATAALILEGALPFLVDLSRAAGSTDDPGAARAAVLNVMTTALAEVNADVSSLSAAESHGGETGRGRLPRSGSVPPRRSRRRPGPRA